MVLMSALFVAGRTISAEEFLRDQSCLVCSAVCATATWRTSCSKAPLKTKGTPRLSVKIVITHQQHKRAVSLYCLVAFFVLAVCYFLVCRRLMRLVDDFLLITPDQHEAQTFLKYDINLY